jgi:processed acidic surface protein
MALKRLLFAIIACFVFTIVCDSTRAMAQIQKQELEQYIHSIGWTMDDLSHYLGKYRMTVADFQSMAELKQWLGTPITEENMQRLLKKHQLTQEELEALLGQFGETVQDYTFVEDLDAAIRFYSRHNEKMQQINDMLSAIGFTESEAKRFFAHIASLPDEHVGQQLAALDRRLQPFLQVEDATQLAKTQRRQLLSIWEDVLSVLQVKAKYYLVENGKKQEIAYRKLAAADMPDGRDLLVELYNQAGDLLSDVRLSEEMFTSGYVMRAGEQWVTAGVLASEMKEMMHGEKMPDTASPYLAHALFGALLALFGFYVYWRTKRKLAE